MLVMINDDMPVPGELTIHFNHVNPGLDCLLKSDPCIFWIVTRGPSVSDLNEIWGGHEKNGVKSTRRALILSAGGLRLPQVNKILPVPLGSEKAGFAYSLHCKSQAASNLADRFDRFTAVILRAHDTPLTHPALADFELGFDECENHPSRAHKPVE